LLALAVVAMLWTLPLVPRDQPMPQIYVYLMYLALPILAHYFAAHGNTIASDADTRSPLGLPSGSVRFLLIAGLVGLGVWVVYKHEEFESLPQIQYTVPLILIGGFLVGWFITRLVRFTHGGRLPAWFQDIQAWLALLSMFGLLIETLLQVFILPSLPDNTRQWVTEAITWQVWLAGIISLYFGARS
jgi:hypothetical protein